MQKIDTQVCLLSESFVNIPDPRLESFSCLWNHCCLFCSCSFPQLLSHLSGIMASLTALIAWCLLEPGTSALLSSSRLSGLTSVLSSGFHVDSCMRHTSGSRLSQLLPMAVGGGYRLLNSVIFYQSLWSRVWSLPRSMTETGLCSHGNWCLLTRLLFFMLSLLLLIH